jgi:hypothetical protein
MTVSQKQCPRCSTVAPLDATFCGQCGRQYRTQFVPSGASSPSAGHAPAYHAPVPAFAPRTPSVTMLRAAQGGVAALACFGVLALSGIFRPDGKSRAPVVTAAPSAPRSVPPAAGLNAEARKSLSEDPIESEARRVVDRESRKLDLPPPVSQDGRIHLRSGGTISKEEWDAASRKAQESPVLREPPKPPPF